MKQLSCPKKKKGLCCFNKFYINSSTGQQKLFSECTLCHLANKHPHKYMIHVFICKNAWTKLHKAKENITVLNNRFFFKWTSNLNKPQLNEWLKNKTIKNLNILKYVTGGSFINTRITRIIAKKKKACIYLKNALTIETRTSKAVRTWSLTIQHRTIILGW